MSYNITLLLSLFLGFTGADRFFVGKIGTAVMKVGIYLLGLLCFLLAGIFWDASDFFMVLGCICIIGGMAWYVVDIFLTFYNKQTDGKGAPLVGQDDRNKAILLGLAIAPQALFGLHRFYLNQTLMGVLKIALWLLIGLFILIASNSSSIGAVEVFMWLSLIVFIGIFIWYIVDIYLVLKGYLKDAQGREIVYEKEKYQTTALLLSIAWGHMGIDRYYMGHKSLAIIKCLTFGGLYIWWLVDIILIILNNIKDSDGQKMIQQ